ncbi:hypothetical protein ACWEWI_35195 [Streptomyces sp. NPDC003753]|uniref:hypothetical protein n=1 Tax=Streptomyces sp. Y2F8-2 TaxID=2759675 RepID=UPI001907304F|nr:hypothetical protein [Streptomyces sp. Y2F8-2]GHK03891.1 hypothetical protein SY2F82_56880 [Streptomyces sp. Y2F8-2]GHK04833.1 hypothetical protein SY2F82_66300 [Streptomyces sp. Y2F8-2]
MTRPLVVGMGGSLRSPSTRLAALCVAVEGAADAGAGTLVIDLKRPALARDAKRPPLDQCDGGRREYGRFRVLDGGADLVGHGSF